ncbi:hypothetical protein ACIA5C_20965 [Actinoplanes sp. NPDC051343]|uniref:hypothetical protein n=1 Tax=Actinoplanes sp. NPDC051343 TaxID=3363906 RepID=UPI00379D5C22
MTGNQTGAGRIQQDMAVAMRRPGLPMPTLPRRNRDANVHYTLTRVGHNGRLADRSLIRELGWPARQHIAIEASADTITARAAPNGNSAITKDGFLLLPALTRHRCDVHNREQVLVAAYRLPELLVIWTMPAVDGMVASRLREHLAGISDALAG